MITVARQQEPTSFDSLVRKPGRTYLTSCKGTTRIDFRHHAYWRHVLKEMHDAYCGVCAYTCHWIPFDTGADTVDHFKAKTTHPRLAYEWSNYRLACGTLNARKGIHQDVLDPFLVKKGWFALQFPSMLILPGANLSPSLLKRVHATIRRLKLNDDDTCVQARMRYAKDYRDGGITWMHLQRDAPFIAVEIERQGLVQSIATAIR